MQINRCENFLKLSLNLINFLFTSNVSFQGPFNGRFSNFLFGILLGKLRIKLQVPLKKFVLSVVKFWQRER